MLLYKENTFLGLPMAFDIIFWKLAHSLQTFLMQPLITSERKNNSKNNIWGYYKEGASGVVEKETSRELYFQK